MKILSSPVQLPVVDFSWYCSDTPPSWREVTVSVPWHGEPGLESVPAVEPTFVRLMVILIGNEMFPLWTVPLHLPLTLLAARAGVASAKVARTARGRMRRRVMLAPIPTFLARQARRDDPVGLQAEPEPLPVLGLHRVEPGQLLHAVEPVGDGVTVGVDRRRRRVHVAVALEVGLERADQVGRVLVVVANDRGDGVLVEGADLLRMRGEHTEQQAVGPAADVLRDRTAAAVGAAQHVEHELGLLDRAAQLGGVGVERGYADDAMALQARGEVARGGLRR